MNPCKDNPPANAVGIVIPMRDGLKFFRHCLHSVLDFTDHPYVLTVVDNLSNLTTKGYLRSIAGNHGINVLRFDEEFNFAAEVNQGLKYVFSMPNVKYGLILNADTIVEPEWLSRMVAVMNSPRLQGGMMTSFAGPLGPVGLVGPLSNIAIPEQQFPGGKRHGQVAWTSRLSGFCMLIKREAFEATGGFDEAFVGGGYEDWDFCVRAREKGFESVVDQGTWIHHYWRGFRREKVHEEQMERNRAYFFRKHPDLKQQHTEITAPPAYVLRASA